MDNQFKELAQSGAYSILKVEMEELLLRYKEVEYNADPYKLSYMHGKKEGAESYCSALQELIEAYAKS